MKENQIKVFFVALFTPIFSGIGILAIPVLLLVVSNLIDYATGLIASNYRGEKINSYKSFKGIAKKICMWLLICVGIMLDVFIMSAGEKFGITIPSLFIISIIVTAWLFINEVISILENIVDIGVEIPAFLLPLVKNIKTKVDKTATDELAASKEAVEHGKNNS